MRVGIRNQQRSTKDIWSGGPLSFLVETVEWAFCSSRQLYIHLSGNPQPMDGPVGDSGSGISAAWAVGGSSPHGNSPDKKIHPRFEGFVDVPRGETGVDSSNETA